MTGYKLQALRAKHKLTQSQMAKIAMVSIRTIQYWEAGTYAIPDYRQKLIREGLKK